MDKNPSWILEAIVHMNYIIEGEGALVTYLWF